MKVLYLLEVGKGLTWYEGVCQACDKGQTITLFDPRKPLDEQFAGVQAVVDQGGSVGSRELMDIGRKHGVKLWQILGTGLDHVDVDYLLQRGFQVANCPGMFSAIALAEHALFLMLYLSKQFPRSQQDIAEQQHSGMTVGELHEKTLGLVGFGASARELARRASALGMTILASDAAPPAPEVLTDLDTQFLGGPEQLESLLGQSDVVSLHVPLLPTTRHMINRETLSWMRPGALLINVARGELVDSDALVEALQSGHVGGAGLDVFSPEPVDPEHPLLQLNNVVATPHLAGCTEGTVRRRGQAAAENINRLAQGLAPLHQITAAE